ncbi:MAG: hypothetical protein V3V14_11020 [Saprospiraceae bacterium]
MKTKQSTLVVAFNEDCCNSSTACCDATDTENCCNTIQCCGKPLEVISCCKSNSTT